MSKKSKIVISILIGIYIIPFFIYKYLNLDSYNIYEGKVIDLTEVTVTEYTMKSKRYRKRVLPVIQYYSKNDTVTFEEGRGFLIGFDIGENVTVLERKDDSYESMVLSFWIYWVRFYDLMIFLLVEFVLIGFYIKFYHKKNPEA